MVEFLNIKLNMKLSGLDNVQTFVRTYIFVLIDLAFVTL